MLDVFPVDGPWAGQLALCGRPRAGAWLEDDIRSLKARGFDLLVSAITSNEIARLGLQDLPYVCHMNGVQAVHFPVGNLMVPEPGAAMLALRGWLEALEDGNGVALHCWATVGRSPMLAAALLVMGGVSPESAWERLAEARGREVPDTTEQRKWVWQLAKDPDVSPA